MFSDKQTVLQKNIVILEHGVVISKKKEVAQKLNNFFIQAVENLNIERFVIRNNDCAFPDKIQEIIAHYESHPSVQKIKQNLRVTNKFQFIVTTSQDIKNNILQLEG